MTGGLLAIRTRISVEEVFWSSSSFIKSLFYSCIIWIKAKNSELLRVPSSASCLLKSPGSCFAIYSHLSSKLAPNFISPWLSWSISGWSDSEVLLNKITFSLGISSPPYFLKDSSFRITNSSSGQDKSQCVITQKTLLGEKLSKKVLAAFKEITSLMF